MRPSSEIGGDTRSCELFGSYVPSRSVLKQPVPSAQPVQPGEMGALGRRGRPALPLVGGAGVGEAVVARLEARREHGVRRPFLGPRAEDQVRVRQLADVLDRVVAERELPGSRRRLAGEVAQLASLGLQADPLQPRDTPAAVPAFASKSGQHAGVGAAAVRVPDVVEEDGPVAGRRLERRVEIRHEVWSRSSRTATWSIVPASGTSIGKVVAARSGIAPGEGRVGAAPALDRADHGDRELVGPARPRRGASTSRL